MPADDVDAPERLAPWAVLAVAATLAASVALRFWAQSDLWFDEALSVNISRLPLDRIPDALRQDGHPPLYYFLLHGWIEVFGIGDTAVRAFSGVISLATLPLAWFAGRRLGGARCAWIATLVLATSPFAFRFATETRMYSFVMLLVLAGYLALRRALEQPRLGRLALVAVLSAALALTQYWDLYLLAAVAAALAWRSVRAPEGERSAPRRVLAAMAVGGLAFAPWLPVFLDQIAHTGTPWGDPQLPWVAFKRSLLAFGGRSADGESFMLASLLIGVVFLAVFGRAVDQRRIELDVRTRPTVRWEAAAALGAFVLGTAASYVTNTTFEPRYAATVFPLVALLVAVGIMVFADRRVRLVIFAAVVALGIAGGVRNVVTDRTQAGEVAAVIAAKSQPGDVVVYCPDQLGPAVSRLLRDVPDLVQVTFPDGDRPARVNWSDYLDRLRAVEPQEFVDAVLRTADGATIWFVTGVGQNNFGDACDRVAGALGASRPGGGPRVAGDDERYSEFDTLVEFPGR